MKNVVPCGQAEHDIFQEQNGEPTQEKPHQVIFGRSLAHAAPCYAHLITLSSVTALDGGGLNVLFNYEGDGTDLVQDVASAIISAAMQVNGDSVAFVSASTQTQMVSTTIAPVIQSQVAASNADQAQLAQTANAAAKAADTSSLTSTIVWVAVGLGVFLIFAPKFIAATTPKVSVST